MEQEKQFEIQKLPQELQNEVCFHLGASDLVALSATNKHFNTITNESKFWRSLLARMYPLYLTGTVDYKQNFKIAHIYRDTKIRNKRILKEFREFQSEPNKSCFAAPLDIQNISVWRGKIFGPENTPYEGGTFLVNISLPELYPFSPPTIHILTKIFHPNVTKEGDISIEILHNLWSPAFTIKKCLLTIHALIETPEPDQPLNLDAALLCKNDHSKFLQTAKEWTQDFAKS